MTSGPPSELADADFFHNSYSLVVEPDSPTHRAGVLPKGESQGRRPPAISQEREGVLQRRGTDQLRGRRPRPRTGARVGLNPVVPLSPARHPATGLGSPDKNTRCAKPGAGTAPRRWFVVADCCPGEARD